MEQRVEATAGEGEEFIDEGRTNQILLWISVS
jgi:hypothetical protein